MNDALALVFDVGTQSVRAMLFDAAGHIVRSAQDIYEQPYYSRNPNWAEQRPDFYFEHICIVSQRLKDQSPEDFARAASVAVTVFRDTTVCMGKDGRPLRDCILWMDQRRAENPKPLPAERRAIFALAGMTETVEMLHRTSACNWIAENEPELWKKTDKYVCLSTYLNYRFTGRIADSSASLMAKIPYDYKNRKWDKNGLTRCVYDIPQDKLCEILPSGSVVGGVTPEASRLTGIPAGLPMLATGSDKGCETLGLAVVDSDKASISLGTTATIQFSTTQYVEPQQFLPAYPGVLNDHYNPEIEIYRGLWLLSWFVKEFGTADAIDAKEMGMAPEALLDARIRDLPAGSDGLLLQPYWTAGILHPDSLGAVIGFSDYHTRYHFYRAIIEGLCLELYMALRIMEDRSGLTIHEIRIGGGGAKSDVVCQIAADVFGLPVVRSQTHEACSIGSSMVAFVAKGVFADFDEAAKAMVHVKDTFRPNEKNHETYNEIYEQAYRKIYPRLRPIYQKLIQVKRRIAQ